MGIPQIVQGAKMGNNAGLIQNHFELFSLNVTFDIDLKVLSENFRTLQQAVHPDRFANASDQERRLSVQRAAQINEAHQVLKSPQRRARYILELQGVTFDDQANPVMAPMFLMQQMELREGLSEVKSKPDPEAALDKILNELKVSRSEVLNKLSEQLNTPENADLDKASQLMHELQFLDKLQSESEIIEEELMDNL